MSMTAGNLMGAIILADNQVNLKELTLRRQLAAVPFGARYRLIDFPLSNLVNAGVRNVGVFVQEKYRSLMDHIGIGKEWDLNRQRDGLFILPPETYSDGAVPNAHSGDLALLRRHIDYFFRSKQEYVVVCCGSIIMNIDLTQMLTKHLNTGADITLLYRVEKDRTDHSQAVEVFTDENSRVTFLKVNPIVSSSSKILLDTYILRRDLLIELVDAAVSSGGSDFVMDVLIRNLGDLKVYGHEFSGYARKICSLETYFNASMELLTPEVYSELFFANGPIFTKVKNEPPVVYLDGATAKNSLIANGCRIEGTVENSILFRGVKVEKGAHVKDSIIMQKSVVGRGAFLENVIVDKDSQISSHKRLVGDRTYPLVIGKGSAL